MNPALSIFIPTHYEGAKHVSAILQALAFARDRPEVEVVVSDNSGSKQKRDLLERFASDNVRILEGPLEGNYRHALQACTGEVLMPMGDDDLLLSASLPGLLAKLEQRPEAVAACGTLMREMPGGYDTFPAGRVDAGLEARVGAWCDLSPRGNPLFHVMARREVMRDAFDLWFEAPNAQAYHDQIASLGVLCAGPMVVSPQPFFAFNFGNWTPDKRIASELHYLKRSGLPVSLVLIQRLLLAIEGYFTVRFRGKAPPDEAAAAASRWFVMWMRYWSGAMNDYLRVPEVLECPKRPMVSAIAQRFHGQDSVDPWQVAAFAAEFYERLNGSGRAYLDHWRIPGIA